MDTKTCFYCGKSGDFITSCSLDSVDHCIDCHQKYADKRNYQELEELRKLIEAKERNKTQIVAADKQQK